MWGSEPGLVAHWSCDEGSGAVLKDVSGNGNDGTIHGAQYVKRARGFCLQFDGIDDYVDCGNRPALDLRETITVEAWVYPETRVTGEPGILGKQFSSFLLTYYADGQCWWYINEGGNHVAAPLSIGTWHHVVATFDGNNLRLYVDGKLASMTSSKFRSINQGGKFYLGCVIGDPSAPDPFYMNTKFFPGMIDEVRVYRRALGEDEIKNHFARESKDLALMAPFRAVQPVAQLRRGGVSLKADAGGALQIETERGSYLVSSAFSYPGDRIGWNHLGDESNTSESEWRPQIRLHGGVLEIEAKGRLYKLLRRVRFARSKITFEDTLTSLSANPVAVIVWNNLLARESFAESFAPGGAETPLIFLRQEHDSLGILAEDNLSRLRFEPSLGVPSNLARFRISNFALDTGKSLTLRWSIYLLAKGADYFDFVNRVRRDWKAIITILGPFAFFDMTSPLLDRPAELRAYLQRKRLGVVALTPWLDYDPGSQDRVWSREEFKEKAQKAIRALKAADPRIKIVGSIETDWVTISPETIKDGDKLPRAIPGQPRPSGRLTPEQTQIIENANLPWMDSVKRDAAGNLELELYVRGGKSQTALSVYPAVGNYQFEFLMGQAKFLMEEVGTDGFYIDEFSQGWNGGIPSFSGWDGVSVEVDTRTGQIKSKFVDCSLAGIEARVRLMRYAFARGGIVIANTYATSMDEQSLPACRFSETWGYFDPMVTPDGKEPPALAPLFRGNLATPIGLGILGKPELQDTARRIMKAVITYLRHGALYYHYFIEDIPTSGPGSGEYGPINHMYPITPLELHKGWILGKERIITCVSGTYTWSHASRPAVYRFDLTGREIPHSFAVRRLPQGWKVEVKITDWAEIVVIE